MIIEVYDKPGTEPIAVYGGSIEFKIVKNKLYISTNATLDLNGALYSYDIKHFSYSTDFQVLFAYKEWEGQ